jgi:hypothetical protein
VLGTALVISASSQMNGPASSGGLAGAGDVGSGQSTGGVGR